MTDQKKPQLEWAESADGVYICAEIAHTRYEISLDAVSGRYVAFAFANTTMKRLYPTCGAFSWTMGKDEAKQACQLHADKLHDAEQAGASAELPLAYGVQEPQEVREAHLVSEQIRRAKAEIGRLQEFLKLWEGAQSIASAVMPDDYDKKAFALLSPQPVAQPMEAAIIDTTDSARDFLRKFCMDHFHDKTFLTYISNDLAGDFACNLARAIVKLPTPQPCPAPAPAPKAAALPPIDPKHPDCSVEVLVREKGDFLRGSYSFEYQEWGTESDRINAEEWWPFPEPGTGTPVPQTPKREIKP